MSNFVNTTWLHDQLERKDFIILDARFSPQDVTYGISQYRKEHIPHAQHIDISTLVDEQSDYGGARAIPYPETLAKVFGSLGIHEQSTVIIYDDSIRPESARIWWLLKFIGHEKAFVLNGGFAKWKKDGYLVEHGQPVVQATEYTPSPRWELALKRDEVARIIELQSAHLIDARSEGVYVGAPDKPGHISTASNYFWQQHVTGDELKSIEDIKEGLKQYDRSEVYVHYCGSGISACFNFLLFDELGYENIKLYPGSFTDWVDEK